MIPESNFFPRIASNDLMYHGLRMRRALSILLILLFGAGPLSFAFAASDDASLPACCRRHGQHHCGMDSEQSPSADSHNAQLKAPSRCPQFPQHPSARTSSFAAISAPFTAPKHLRRDTATPEQSDTGVTSIHLRIPVLRGPPAISFA